MTSPLSGPIGSPVPARPAGAALITADPADGLAGGVENFFATLSNLLGGLPGGQFTDFLAGAALLARRQLFGESSATPANSVVGTGLPVPIPPIAPDMVRDLSVAVTGAQALALSWKTPAKGTPTSYTVSVETTPTDPSQEPTVSTISTSSESATFSALNPLDQYVFSVAAVYESGPGAARTTSYAATDGFLALTSLLNHPTAMLTAGDGSMWISYRPNLTDYAIKDALGCLGNAWCSQVFKIIPGARWVAKEYRGLPDQVKEVIAKVAQQPPPPPQVRQYKLVDGQWRLQTAILTEGRPQALAEDIEGNIWVASETGGFQGFLSALFPDFGNNTGVVQRIALESGRMQVAETIDVAGAPMLGSLVAAPDGGIWVGLDNRWGGWRPWPTPTVADGGPAVQLRRPTNGSVQGIYRTAAGVWTADPNPFKLRHPPVGLTVGADGTLWATDTLKSNSGIAAYFGVNFTDLAVKTTLTRINPVTGERTDTNIGRGGQGVIAIPGQDAVVVATHDGWLTYSQGGGQIKKVEYREGKLKTAGQIDLNAEWFGVPSSDFRLQPDAGRPDSFTIAPDGSIWTSGRGANGQLRSNLFIGALDYVLGPLGAILPKIIRYSWELRSLVCQYKDCTFTPLIKYPDFKGSPGFIAQVWTPDRGLAAGQPTKFAAVPYRQVSGSVSPVAAPVQRGFWVDAGGAPLLIPMTPGTPAGLDATAGSSPGQVTLNWTPTAADGGTPVMSYTATVYQGDTAQTFTRQTATTAGTSATFDGLASGAGTTYFTVSPTNFVGTSTDRLGNVRSAGLWLAADGTPLSIDHLGVGIASDGMPFTDGGFDTYGNAYSWSALGGSDALRWNGVTFDIATANQPNFTRSEGQRLSTLADGQTLASQQVKPLGSNSYYMLNLAGAGVNGAQTGQAISLNYSDGTSETWTQSFSDWVNPQHYTGEAVVSTQSYANTAAGGTANLTNHVYGYSHPIAQGKTLESITLPNNPNLRLLDVEVTAATTVQLGNALNTFGITTPPWQVGNSQGFDGRGNYYNGPNLNGNFTTKGTGSVPSTVMMTWAGAVFPVGPVPTSSDQVGGSSGPRNVVHAAGQLISVPAPPEQPGPCSGAACRQYTVLDTITVGDGGVGVSPAGGQGLALSGDGTRLYVLSNAGASLAVIDTGTGAVVNSIAVESGSAEGVAVSKDGTRLYVTNLLSGTVSVLDAATGAVTKTLSGLGAPWDVVVSPDGKHAYVSNVDGGTAAPVSVITTATNAITATVSDPADTAFGLAVDGAGRLYVAADKQVFVTDSGAAPAVVNTFDLAAFAGGMTANTDGSRLYVATRDTGEVQVFSYPYTAGYTTSALGGFDGPVAVALSPDGGRLYVANRDGNSVSVVDTASNTIIATLDVGSKPVDVAVSPDGTRVYVANNSGTVSVIAYDPTQLAAGYAYLIGAGANGAQVDQRITMVFADRTESTWTQTFSDWANPGSVNGEAIMSLGGRVNQLGNQTDVPAYVYGYAIPVPADKTLASLILPDNPNLGILGVAVV